MEAPYHFMCGRRHWSGEECKLPDVKPRPWIKEFLGVRPSSAPVATKPRTKPVTARHETPATKQTFVTCAGPECSNPLPTKTTGRPGKYCSGTCRKRASRAK